MFWQRERLVVAIQILAIGVLATVLRIHDLATSSLWMDEVISATHIETALWRIPFAVFRYDMHPPLYFMQLGLWSKLGNSDQFLLLNSVIWGLAVIGAVWVLAARLYGPRAAFIAAFLTAISPGAIEYSQSLRMYSMMSFFIIVTLILYDVWTKRIEDRVKGFNYPFLSIILLAIGICYTHAVGFFFVFFLSLYGFYRIWTVEGLARDRKISLFWRLLFSYALVAVLAVPIIARSAVAPSASYSMDSLSMILTQVTLVFFGRGSGGQGVFSALTVLLLAAILCFSMLREERRRFIWILALLLPLAVNIAISAFVKPVFKPWLFSYAAPLGCVALAGIIVTFGRLFAETSRLKVVAMAAATGAVALSFLAGLSLYYQPLGKPQDYRGAAAYIREHAAPGDGVVGVGVGAYWAMARYLAGPGWGSPLDIADLTLTDLWVKVHATLPDGLRRVAGVAPRTNSLQAGPLTLIAGRSRSTAEAAMQHQRVWVVRSLQDISKMPNIEGFPVQPYCLVTTSRPKGVVLELYEKRPSCP